jgi:hypothetical protein
MLLQGNFNDTAPDITQHYPYSLYYHSARLPTRLLRLLFLPRRVTLHTYKARQFLHIRMINSILHTVHILAFTIYPHHN